MSEERAAKAEPEHRTYFVTGFPGFIGRKLVEKISRAAPKSRIYVLVQPKFVDDARRRLERLKAAHVELLAGDIVDMHLGLSGEEYQMLCDSVTDIFHLAAI